MRSIPDSSFRTSSYSQPNGSNCVEVGTSHDFSAMRDTQHRHLGRLEFPNGEWTAMLALVRHSHAS